MPNKVGGVGLISIMFSIVAYFVYNQSISAMLGMLLLVIGSGFTTLLSFIPFVGVIIAYFANTIYTYPTIMGFVGITSTWLTTILLIFHTIIGIVLTIISSAIVLKLRN